MKALTMILPAAIVLLVGCRSNNDSVEARANREYLYPHSEPFSKEQRETIDEPAGAQSQSREGEENPFIKRRAGQTQQVGPDGDGSLPPPVQ